MELVATVAKKLDTTRNELLLSLPNQLSAKAPASGKKLSPKSSRGLLYARQLPKLTVPGEPRHKGIRLRTSLEISPC
jgi:hypothetical protein